MNKSAGRVADILDLIAKHHTSLSIAEISRSLAIPKSSTFELVYTLVDKGFLECDDQRLNTFRLGLKLFEVGAAFLTKTDLYHAARPQMEYLLSQTNRTVFLATENCGQVVYLDKVEPYTAVFTGAMLGSRNPMHCTGLGKALLASYSAEKVKTITGTSELKAKTVYSITSYDILVMELEKIRQMGYSIDNQESEIDIFCIAAPLYDRQGHAVAAISLASPASVMDQKMVDHISKLVTATALTISRKLGFLGSKLYS